MRKKKKAEAEVAQNKLNEAMDRFKRASSENRETARSIIPPAERVEDTSKFSIPPPPPAAT
jgi:hypothetical protein